MGKTRKNKENIIKIYEKQIKSEKPENYGKFQEFC